MNKILASLIAFSLASLAVHANLTPLVPSEVYPNLSIIDETNVEQYRMFWKVINDEIQFEIHCKANGWVAFGISPYGDMFGADIAIGWVANNGVGSVRDTFSITYDAPVVDKKQDWVLLDSKQVNGFTLLKMKRKLNTLDTLEDIAIKNELHRMIFAWSDDDPVNDNWEYHAEKRLTKTVRLLGA